MEAIGIVSAPPVESDALTMPFIDRLKSQVRRLLIRIALVVVGCVALLVAIAINFDAGEQIVAGLRSPDSPTAIVISVARLVAPIPGLWLIFRGLR